MGGGEEEDEGKEGREKGRGEGRGPNQSFWLRHWSSSATSEPYRDTARLKTRESWLYLAMTNEK